MTAPLKPYQKIRAQCQNVAPRMMYELRLSDAGKHKLKNCKSGGGLPCLAEIVTRSRTKSYNKMMESTDEAAAQAANANDQPMRVPPSYGSYHDAIPSQYKSKVFHIRKAIIRTSCPSRRQQQAEKCGILDRNILVGKAILIEWIVPHTKMTSLMHRSTLITEVRIKGAQKSVPVYPKIYLKQE